MNFRKHALAFVKAKGIQVIVCIAIVGATEFMLFRHYTNRTYRDDVIAILEKNLLDFRMFSRGVQAPKSKLGVLAIDNKAINDFGRWPFSRKVYRKAFQNLKAAGVQWIAMDVVFSEPERIPLVDVEESLKPLAYLNSVSDRKIQLGKIHNLVEISPADRDLAEAFKEFGNIVLGYFYLETQEDLVSSGREKSPYQGLDSMAASQIEAVILPEKMKVNAYPNLQVHGVVGNMPSFAKSVPYFGFLTNAGDEDAVIRWITLLRIMDGKVMPSVSLKLASEIMKRDILVEFDSLGVSSVELISREDESDVIRVPSDSLGTGRALLNHRGPSKTFRHISLSDAVHNTFDEATRYWLKDSSLFTGMTAVGVNDIRPNPFDAAFDGVEVQLTAVDNIVNQDLIVRPQTIYIFEMILVLMLGLLFTPIVVFLRPLYAGLITVSVLVGYYYFDKYYWFAKQQWVYMGVPFIEVSLLYIVSTSLRFLSEEIEKRKIKGAFGHYLAPEVIDRIMDNPGTLKLGGERKELSVFFSDVRGFTSISETLSPEKLCEFMNAYFTPMTEVILKSGGVLDKFIGDAVMAFWGAPIPLEDHADRAVQAGIQMLFALEKLQHDFAQRQLPFVDIGMGINTGDMSVGNMGSQERFCYTVMGDAVNLGSRIEQLTKLYKVHLIVSDTTVDRLISKPTLRELDDVMVKGKHEGIRIHQVLKPGEMDEKILKEFLGHFAEARMHYKQQQWEKALRSFQECLKMVPNDGPSVLFCKRIEEYKQQPFLENWDGVYKTL